ncbi:hypothetical protein [Xanthomonas arboricola]|uniref:hypothetical protein n=1 Tax=Xanthomonas arboricola TaxID=56448 RepID=UPI00128FED38|nr:hypothetical protein [Xanthomonas arboricola]
MKVKIEILDQGGEVIGFYENKIVIKKKTGELEIFTLVYGENKVPRIEERSVLITFKSAQAAKASIVDENGSFEVGSF